MHTWTLVLAAGQSERFGGVKALAPWRDSTLFSHALKLARGISDEKIYVVLGGHAEKVRPYCADVCHSVNPQWQQGMGTSISWGVQRILEQDPNADAIVILPIDQPLISIQHLENLLQTSHAMQKCALSESQEKVHGPPAVLHRDFFGAAMSLQGDKGLKSILRDYETVTDAMALQDVDTQQELADLPASVFIASYATKLSLVEIVLGSIVHGFKIPFGGNLLSLNQGIFMCRATRHFSSDPKASAFVPLQVASVSAVLKSLSPAGQKLGPMIAISMQGLLYSVCILFLGPSRVAQSIGMMLSSLWSFVQPIFMLWVFYGESLSKAAFFFYDKLKETIPAFAHVFVFIFMGLVAFKVIVAAALPWLLAYFGVERFDQLTDRASEKASQYMFTASRAPAQSQWQALKYTLRDLTKPAFFIPCLLVTFFLVFSESRNAQWIWKMMRPLAAATVFFYLSHTPWMYRLSSYLRRRGYFLRFFAILDQTRENLAHRKGDQWK